MSGRANAEPSKETHSNHFCGSHTVNFLTMHGYTVTSEECTANINIAHGGSRLWVANKLTSSIGSIFSTQKNNFTNKFMN